MVLDCLPRAVVLGCLALLWAGVAHGQPVGPTREAPAGGLHLVNEPAIVIDRKDLHLSLEATRATYVLRNITGSPHTILIAFPLPDLDMVSIGDQAVALPVPGEANFVGASIVADDVRVPLEIEQRALAIGLDVTATLKAAEIPLMPTAPDTAGRLARLANVLKTDLQQRGVIRIEDEKAWPNWVLKSTAYWRQTFNPQQTITVRLDYRPIWAAQRYDPELITSMRASHCMDTRIEAEITRKVAAHAGNVTFHWTAYHLTAGSGLLTHPIGKIRILIEKPEIDAVLATCRKGLRQLGPTAFEWLGQEFYPDDDISLLLIR